jgi:colanic acid/amylovoran biosynthesis glycosyltransferase
VIELGCPPEKVHVQHLGVDLARIEHRPRRLAAGEREVRFLAAGRVMHKKGHELAVRAFALARRELPRARLGLILIPPERGAAEALAPIEQAIREEGVGDSVELSTYLPYGEYLAALQRYHVFLAPSRHAPDGDAEGGAPVALIEVSAMGLPIVAARHCDIPEVVRDGESGLLFAEGDVEAMAAAMVAIGSAPESWERYGRAGRAHVEREYDARAQARRLEALYDELAAR